jgi:hypothetical protein
VESALARRPRVWVLLGGDGDERHAALASGANVVAKLRHYPDLQVGWGLGRRQCVHGVEVMLWGSAGAEQGRRLPSALHAPSRSASPLSLRPTPPPPSPSPQVEAFLLPPPDAGEGEAKRRAALLGRATEYATIGIPESDWPESMARPQLQ